MAIYEIAGHRISGAEPNLLSVLGKFQAYRDPVFKKSYFYLGLMSNSGVWAYRRSWRARSSC